MNVAATNVEHQCSAWQSRRSCLQAKHDTGTIVDNQAAESPMYSEAKREMSKMRKDMTAQLFNNVRSLKHTRKIRFAPLQLQTATPQ